MAKSAAGSASMLVTGARTSTTNRSDHRPAFHGMFDAWTHSVQNRRIPLPRGMPDTADEMVYATDQSDPAFTSDGGQNSQFCHHRCGQHPARFCGLYLRLQSR